MAGAFPGARNNRPAVSLVHGRQGTEREPAGIGTGEGPERNLAFSAQAYGHAKQEGEAEEAGRPQAATLPDNVASPGPGWGGPAKKQTEDWLLPWTDRYHISGRAARPSGGHAAQTGFETGVWGGPLGGRDSPDHGEGFLFQLGSTNEHGDLKGLSSKETSSDWSRYGKRLADKDQTDRAREESPFTLPVERISSTLSLPSGTFASPAHRFLMPESSSVSNPSSAFTSGYASSASSVSAPARPVKDSAYPSSLSSRISVASSRLAEGPEVLSAGAPSASPSPSSLSGLHSSFPIETPPPSVGTHTPLSVDASSAQASPVSGAVPAAVPFIIGIVLSLVGTLLSALGDVCIRYSFVRTQSSSSPAVSPAPLSNSETLPVVAQRPDSSSLLSGAPGSSTTRFSSSPGGTAFDRRASGPAPAPPFLSGASLPLPRTSVDNDCPENFLLPLSEHAEEASGVAGGRRRTVEEESSSAAEEGSFFSRSSAALVQVAAPCVCGWEPLWTFGVFCSCVASPLLSVVALSLLPANVTGFAALQIFFVVILAWFILGEVVDRVNLAGTVNP